MSCNLPIHTNADIWAAVTDASPIINKPPQSYLRNRAVWERAFVGHFGLKLDSFLDVWIHVRDEFQRQGLKRLHLLWALLYLKVYPTEILAASHLRTSPTNYREKVHVAVDILAELHGINMEDRWVKWNLDKPSCYLDGLDVIIRERRPIDKGLYSHKFHHAGYRYQVATALGISAIVLVAGGLPCGSWSDMKMARQFVFPLLEEGEWIAADRGYRGDRRIISYVSGTGAAVRRHNENIKNMKARHETVNKRLKDFNILVVPFRGDIGRHNIVFAAVAEVTNIKLRREPLMDFTLV
ncbi:hypothetical protein HDU76_009248 [Blyttiomyces sp. JEL0837]|nr:hypothetical protein HDU76_009248 [Blyttiomyces sp. JEL0837]